MNKEYTLVLSDVLVQLKATPRVNGEASRSWDDELHYEVMVRNNNTTNTFTLTKKELRELTCAMTAII